MSKYLWYQEFYAVWWMKPFLMKRCGTLQNPFFFDSIVLMTAKRYMYVKSVKHGFPCIVLPRSSYELKRTYSEYGSIKSCTIEHHSIPRTRRRMSLDLWFVSLTRATCNSTLNQVPSKCQRNQTEYLHCEDLVSEYLEYLEYVKAYQGWNGRW